MSTSMSDLEIAALAADVENMAGAEMPKVECMEEDEDPGFPGLADLKVPTVESMEEDKDAGVQRLEGLKVPKIKLMEEDKDAGPIESQPQGCDDIVQADTGSRSLVSPEVLVVATEVGEQEGDEVKGESESDVSSDDTSDSDEEDCVKEKEMGGEAENPTIPAGGGKAGERNDPDGSRGGGAEARRRRRKKHSGRVVGGIYDGASSEEESDAFVKVIPRSAHEVEAPVEPLGEVMVEGADTVLMGTILSLVMQDSTIVVKGEVGSKPLDEGSVLSSIRHDKDPPLLWPLGRVHEVFGPVVMPHYIIKVPVGDRKTRSKQVTEAKFGEESVATAEVQMEANSGQGSATTAEVHEDDEAQQEAMEEAEVGIENLLNRWKVGEKVYVLAGHAKYVTATQLASGAKGSDASNYFDEECAPEELDYSDDEQEKIVKAQAKKARQVMDLIAKGMSPEEAEAQVDRKQKTKRGRRDNGSRGRGGLGSRNGGGGRGWEQGPRPAGSYHPLSSPPQYIGSGAPPPYHHANVGPPVPGVPPNGSVPSVSHAGVPVNMYKNFQGTGGQVPQPPHQIPPPPSHLGSGHLGAPQQPPGPAGVPHGGLSVPPPFSHSNWPRPHHQTPPMQHGLDSNLLPPRGMYMPPPMVPVPPQECVQPPWHHHHQPHHPHYPNMQSQQQQGQIAQQWGSSTAASSNNAIHGFSPGQGQDARGAVGSSSSSAAVAPASGQRPVFPPQLPKYSSQR